MEKASRAYAWEAFCNFNGVTQGTWLPVLALSRSACSPGSARTRKRVPARFRHSSPLKGYKTVHGTVLALDYPIKLKRPPALTLGRPFAILMG